jgi:hypothetical protein
MLMTSSGSKFAIGLTIKSGTDGGILFVGPDSEVAQSLQTSYLNNLSRY